MAIILDEAASNLLDEGSANILDEATPGPGFTSDSPQITPGPLWLRYFKPGYPHPFWPIPVVQSPQVQGNLALGPLGFAGQVSQTGADIPQFNPGPTWFGMFKPWIQRQRERPVPPVVPSVNFTGSFRLAPLSLSGAYGFSFGGHYTVFYLDYIDNVTSQTLACIPGGIYTMFPVSSRAGLTIPPNDGRWIQAPGGGFNPQSVPFRPGRPHIHLTLTMTPSPERLVALVQRGADTSRERHTVAITLSTTFANALLSTSSSGVATQIGGGTLVIYTGSGPAGPNEAPTGTILATFIFSGAGSQGAPSGGSMNLSFVANTVTAGNTGTAGYFRIINSSAVSLIQGSVGTANADWNLSSVLINNGDSVSITGTPTISWTVA